MTQENALIQFDHTNAQHFVKFSVTAYNLYCVQFLVERKGQIVKSCYAVFRKKSEACDGYSVPFILTQNHAITVSRCQRFCVTGTTTIRSSTSGVHLPEL